MYDVISPQIGPHNKVGIFHIIQVKKLKIKETKNLPEGTEMVKHKPTI